MARTDTVLSSKTEPITALKEFTATKPSQKAGQRLGVAIDRTGWTDQTAEVTVRMHVSLDNGKTWFQWCGLSDRGGGLPQISKRRREREKDLSESLEQTMRALLWHPKTVAAVAASVAGVREDRRQRDRQATVRTMVETRARLADEQDDEEWILMS